MIRFIATAVTAALLAVPASADIDIQVIDTPGGLTAWLVEEHEIPFVALELRFGGGTSLDAPGKRGATNLMMALLEEGAGDLTAQDFARRAEELAASFDFDANSDSVSVSARFLTENQDQAIDLLRLALTDPAFGDADVERVRGQVLANIRSDLKDPDEIAVRRFNQLAFGDHPYASSGDGTIDSVTALTRDDLLAAHKAVLARDRIYISAVGDIDADTLAALLDRLLGDLPATGAPLPPMADYQLAPGMTVVPFDTPQSVAIFGHEGFERDDPDFFAAYILNEIMGGSGFNSRLQDEVREKRGLTYGVYTYLAPRDYGPLYMGYVASANGRVAEALDVIRGEWTRMATEGVTEDELEETKTYLTGAYPLRFDGNARIADILVGMQESRLEPEYVKTRNAQLQAVTLEDVRRVAARLLHPEAMHFVVVGQPEGLEAGN